MVYLFLIVSVAAACLYLVSGGLFASWHVLWRLPLAALVCFLALTLLFVLVIGVCVLTVNEKKEQKQQSKFFCNLLCQFTRFVLPLANVHVHTTGLEKLPQDTRFVLISNHRLFLDPLIYYSVMPHAGLAFVAKKEALSMPVVKQFMHKLMCLPIDRDNDRAALRTILKAIDYIMQDKVSIAVFPEGGTNRTGKPLLPFRNGVFKIAQKAEVPIVVCALSNTQQVFKNIFRRRTDVYLDVLDVLPPTAFCCERTLEIGDETHSIMEAALVARQKEA